MIDNKKVDIPIYGGYDRILENKSLSDTPTEKKKISDGSSL